MYATDPVLDLSDVNLFNVVPTVFDLIDVECDPVAFNGRSLT